MDKLKKSFHNLKNCIDPTIMGAIRELEKMDKLRKPSKSHDLASFENGNPRSSRHNGRFLHKKPGPQY